MCPWTERECGRGGEPGVRGQGVLAEGREQEGEAVETAQVRFWKVETKGANLYGWVTSMRRGQVVERAEAKKTNAHMHAYLDGLNLEL